ACGASLGRTRRLPLGQQFVEAIAEAVHQFQRQALVQEGVAVHPDAHGQRLDRGRGGCGFYCPSLHTVASPMYRTWESGLRTRKRESKKDAKRTRGMGTYLVQNRAREQAAELRRAADPGDG